MRGSSHNGFFFPCIIFKHKKSIGRFSFYLTSGMSKTSVNEALNPRAGHFLLLFIDVFGKRSDTYIHAHTYLLIL